MAKQPTYTLLEKGNLNFESTNRETDLLVSSLRYDFNAHRAFFIVACDLNEPPWCSMSFNIYEDTGEVVMNENENFTESDYDKLVDFARNNINEWIERARETYIVPYPFER